MLAISVLCSAFSMLALAQGSEAEAFCNAVSELESKTEIEEQAVALIAADAALADYLAISGNKKTDAAIADKYEALVSIKNEMFVYYVGEASDAHFDEDYPTTRLNLDLAGAILITLEMSELTVIATSYHDEYTSIVEELREPEELSAAYISRANAAKTAPNFAEAKKNYDAAKLTEKNLSLEGYPGIEEAKALLDEVQIYLADCTVGAAGFLAAVDNVYSAGNFFQGVAAAYAAYEALPDTTVTGVYEAKENLDLMVSRHNDSVENANDMAKDMNSVIYGLILGDEKNMGTGNTFIDWINKTFG